MICANCRVTIPDESTFCLRCGTRLVPVERLAPVNGGQGRPVALIGAKRPVAAAPRPTAAPGGKEAYALSFRPLVDERVRYRVARWVCEVAPTHQISEVQQGLTIGGFATFLALTPAEAEVTRQRIQALGAHPELWQLAPAVIADVLMPERPRSTKQEWSPQKKFAAVGIGLLIFFLFTAISWNRYHAATTRGAQPGDAPAIGGQR